MDWDEVRPKPAKGIVIGENLETLSVGELEVRIKALEDEIRRVNAELDKKQTHERAAAQLFKR